MKIHRMTATFGKLEHETLTLEPGLNVIQAENEWGKSTWCAFLLAMLYGVDTRAKTTKTTLADKERYAPWSGSPMSGSMDLCWKGRDITIERSTKGRIPLGEFRAFDTATGVVVPELTAANCGQMLLGVEQSVFRRAGFIRFADLPVTQDDALRRRLNALVTTGDESGDGERLERSLRELKNKCRYNRTGLIPQAEEERTTLEGKLEERLSLEKQVQKLERRLEEISCWIKQLENHRAALQFTAAEENADRTAQAKGEYEATNQRQAELEALCAKLPGRDQAERRIRELREYQEQWHSVQMELSMLPERPRCPVAPPPFENMELEQARQMVKEDALQYTALGMKKPGALQFLASGVCLLFSIYLAAVGQYWYLAGTAVAGMILLALALGSRKKRNRAMAALEGKYGSSQPERWRSALEEYAGRLKQHSMQMVNYRVSRGDLDGRIEALKRQRQSLCGSQSAEKVLDLWQQVLKRWEDYYSARREAQRAKAHLQDLQAMVKSQRPPVMEDSLSYTESETARLLSDAVAEQQRLQNRIGQHQGRMDALGDRSVLENQLNTVNQRLSKLENTYTALNLALETLAQAKRELQRRFAPRIAKRAQEHMETMTSGRYHRFAWGEDFDLSAGAEGENILRSVLWRSDGTVDQLYLALRLAVAEELMPQCPLILDDALVRFDDERVKKALKILKGLSAEKQVILFTCQRREREFAK